MINWSNPADVLSEYHKLLTIPMIDRIKRIGKINLIVVKLTMMGYNHSPYK
jgi:hypothetical protein